MFQQDCDHDERIDSDIDGEVISVDNLAELSLLNEETLLRALQQRYDNGRIYTNVGEILVALNPFRPLPLYGPALRQRYGLDSVGRSRDSTMSEGRFQPHIYDVARRAYSEMMAQRRHQVCVISGESGAGKTESCKFLIRQLMELCQSTDSGPGSLEAKIVQVNPLLEAFGNAQTALNDNSSRFGKYIDLIFDANTGGVIGATVNQYLLEKSRVARQGDVERNFHVFYYMFAGLPHDVLSKVHLRRPSQHRYLSNCPAADRFTNSDQCKNGYHRMKECMEDVEMSYEQAMDVFFILAGVLLLGDMDFGEGSVAFCSPVSSRLIEAARALGLDPAWLSRALTVSSTVAKGEVITINYSAAKASNCRDAMAKAIFGRLFNYIVAFLNGVLAPAQHTNTHLLHIGILDIFGFETFESNSFEQFCINLANERLQHYFNDHIFLMEKEQLKEEGVKIVDVSFDDNSPIVQLFLAKPFGLLSLLDEQTNFPQGNDASCLAKFAQHSSKHPAYRQARGRKMAFTITHYAGQVMYDVTGFIDKNRDAVPENVMEILRNSRSNLLRGMFVNDTLTSGAATLMRKRSISLHLRRNSSLYSRHSSRHQSYHPHPHPRKTSGTSGAVAQSKNRRTVSSQFRASLDNLMKEMNTAQPHFVRCIKPNRTQQANTFDTDFVLAQLRYTGVLETVRIRKEGYAFRPTFLEFMTAYKSIGYQFTAKVKPTAASCGQVLERSGIDGWQIGKNRVFLKYFHPDQLQRMLALQHAFATTIQQHCRGFLARKRYKDLLRQAQQERVRVKRFCKGIRSGSKAVFSALSALQAEDTARQKAKVKKLIEALHPPVVKAVARPPKPKERKLLTRRRSPVMDWSNPEHAFQQYGTAQTAGTADGEEEVRDIDKSCEPTVVFAQQPEQQSIELEVSTPQQRSSDQPLLPHEGPSTSPPSWQRPSTTTPKTTTHLTPDYMPPPHVDQKALEDWRKKEFERRSGLFQSDMGIMFSAWFHGLVPRWKAEEMVQDQSDGTFLIRISESRFGYCCTVLWQQSVRHYLIEQLPGCAYRLLGEPRTFSDLTEFVNYHSCHPLSDEGDLLLYPCDEEAKVTKMEAERRGLSGIGGYKGRSGWRATSSPLRRASSIKRSRVAGKGKGSRRLFCGNWSFFKRRRQNKRTDGDYSAT